MMEQQPASRQFSPIVIIFLMTSLLGLLGAVGMLLSENSNNANREATAPRVAENSLVTQSIIGEVVPDFQLTSITGELVSLSQFKGRPVFINLWWTGCPPCVEEFPTFQQFVEEQGIEGAVVIAINQGEELAPVRKFAEDLSVHDVIVLLDPDMQIPRILPHNNMFPVTYLLDEQGVVQQRKIGAFSLDELYIYLQTLYG
jgi:thiol-disulfide isomerase/thioredoxin